MITTSADVNKAGKTSKYMKNQRKITTPKEHNNCPVTDSKQMQICDLTQ